MDKNSALLTIDLEKIRENYGIFCALAGENCAVSAVVKANAYGLGMGPVSGALYEAGCRAFFTASPEEGAALRNVLPDSQIAVLNGFYKGFEKEYAQYGLMPVLNSLEEIGRFQKAGGGACILHFNTAMNRLGIEEEEAQKIFEDRNLLDGLNVTCVMSHFACADEAGHVLNEVQFEKFKEIAAHFPHAKKSLANSSGSHRDPRYHFDMVRPGMGLYGLNPVQEKDNPMKNVIRVDAGVLQIRQASRGETIGYGATYTFEKDSVLATAALGYADGILWSLGNKGALFWKGYKLPVRGRVSMDLLSVDLSGVPENERPVAGDRLEVIGEHQSADDLAAAAGTIGYEILTALGGRYKRIYKNQAAVRTLASAASISS